MTKSRLKFEPDFLWPIQLAKNLLTKSMMTWLLLSLITFQLQAKGRAEEGKISLVKEIASLKEILKDVERQTTFRFFYNHDQVDVSRTLSINLKEVTLTRALDEIFKETSIGYKISGHQILLFQKEGASGEVPQQLEATL